MGWPRAADRPLVDVLRALPAFPRAAGDVGDLLVRAELHGISGVVADAATRAGALPVALAAAVAQRGLARELDHAAHLALLRRIDAALEASAIRGVALKGPLLAERLYERPSARATTDVDLLVNEADLERASTVLRGLGYRLEQSQEEQRFRREHHHLHLSHPDALPLELHFHAYRGFGQTLRSEELLARARPAGGFRALRVLEPSDELLFLAVHAAAHRFVRLGWLLDIRLLLERVTSADVDVARARALRHGFAAPLAFTGSLLVELLGVPAAAARPLGRLGRVRRSVVRGVAGEPAAPILRSATRFVFTAGLCDSVGGAARYATASSARHARDLALRVRGAG